MTVTDLSLLSFIPNMEEIIFGYAYSHVPIRCTQLKNNIRSSLCFLDVAALIVFFSTPKKCAKRCFTFEFLPQWISDASMITILWLCSFGAKLIML